MATLDELMDLRVEVWAAFAGNRKLDAMVLKATHDDHESVKITPPYTTSIDAAVALAEELFPGCVWHLLTDFGGLRRARIYQDDVTASTKWQDDGDTPALAMVATILTALIALKVLES
jgi:hypothetical protein